MSFIDAYHRMNIDTMRTEVINLLKQAYSGGQITVETLERRLREANTVTTKEELITLVSDIPMPEGAESGAQTSGAGERDWYVNDRIARENQTFFAVLGGSERTGQWQPAKRINCFSLMGGIKIDLREAEFPRSGVSINAGSIMGCLEVIVPPGINIDVSGLPLLGSFENDAGEGRPGAPTLRIRGMVLMGSVEVKRKERKEADSRPSKSSRKRRK